MGMTTILIFEHHVDSTKQFKVWICGWKVSSRKPMCLFPAAA